MKSTFIKYPYFVKTNSLDVAREWAEKHSTGKYQIDTGAWRDYNPQEEKGIEFEYEHDALTYLHRFGGTLVTRSPVKDAGI